MAGKQGQRSKKPTETSGRYAQDFLKGMDRRCRQARRLRDRYLRTVERCGGVRLLDEEDLDRIQRYIFINHRQGQSERASLNGHRPEESALNDTLRSWLALDRRIEILKARGKGATDLARAIQEELTDEAAP